MENPLPVADAKPVTMSEAASAFAAVPSAAGDASTEGGTIVLPDTAQVTPSDVGAVWMNQVQGETKLDTAVTVAVTFPSQGLIITYDRPTVTNPLAYIKDAIAAEPDYSQLIWLGSVPSWAIPDLANGSNWGMIQFIAGGTMVQVMGHTDLASLQAVAQSIVDQTNTSG
jgi:hypothetical protein